MIDLLSKRNEFNQFDYSESAIFLHQLYDEQIRLRQQQQQIHQREQELLLKQQQQLQQQLQEQLEKQLNQLAMSENVENEQTKSIQTENDKLYVLKNLKDLQKLVEFANEQIQLASQPPPQQQQPPPPLPPLLPPPAKRPKYFPASITYHSYPTPDTSGANENQSGGQNSRSRLIAMNSSSPLSKQKSFGFRSNEMESSSNNLIEFSASTNKSDLTQPDEEDYEEDDEDEDVNGEEIKKKKVPCHL